MDLDNKRALLKQFEKIDDFRIDKHKIKYPLHEVLFMALFALLQGNMNYDDIHSWIAANANGKIFKRLFKKRKVGVPSVSTLHHLLVNVDNNSLELIFREYFKRYSTYDNVAVDGKWLNGSDIDGQYLHLSHKSILNILDKDKKIVVGHKMLGVDKKSEIPAATEILKDGSFFKEGQIFSFDALMTQIEILNTINDQKSKYIAKVKGNQKSLKNDLIDTVNSFSEPTDIYKGEYYKIEGNKEIKRTVDIYQDSSCDIVIYNSDFKNIQTIIRVTKESIDLKSNTSKTTVEYLIANFKTTAKEFYTKILQHWRIETYHYHLDTLTLEDDHIAYINPFSISILRSFTINLYQLFLNANKDTKILGNKKISMARIKKNSMLDMEFVSNLFEIPI
jgi:predicted transposase YbfD/YdcC